MTDDSVLNVEVQERGWNRERTGDYLCGSVPVQNSWLEPRDLNSGGMQLAQPNGQRL